MAANRWRGCWFFIGNLSPLLCTDLTQVPGKRLPCEPYGSTALARPPPGLCRGHCAPLPNRCSSSCHPLGSCAVFGFRLAHEEGNRSHALCRSGSVALQTPARLRGTWSSSGPAAVSPGRPAPAEAKSGRNRGCRSKAGFQHEFLKLHCEVELSL